MGCRSSHFVSSTSNCITGSPRLLPRESLCSCSVSPVCPLWPSLLLCFFKFFPLFVSPACPLFLSPATVHVLSFCVSCKSFSLSVSPASPLFLFSACPRFLCLQQVFASCVSCKVFLSVFPASAFFFQCLQQVLASCVFLKFFPLSVPPSPCFLCLAKVLPSFCASKSLLPVSC